MKEQINSNNNNSISSEQIDRYIYEVTKRLPEKQRDDISKELRSLIEDMLQDQFPEKEITIDEVNIVLEQLGNPAVFADKYRENKKYLIGPEFYDIYFLILKIVLSAVLFGLIIAFFVGNLITPPDDIFKLVLNVVSGIFSGLFQAFAWVTIIFAILSHYGEPFSEINLQNTKSGNSKEWKPSDLSAIPVKNARIKKSEPIVGIIFIVLFIILINSSIDLLGIMSFTPDGTRIVTFFDPIAIQGFLPLINLVLIIGLVKELIKLFVGKYTIQLSVSIFLLSIISTILTLLVFTTPTIWNHNFVSEINALFSITMVDDYNIAYFWTNLYRLFIGITIFGFAVETISNFYKSIRYGK